MTADPRMTPHDPPRGIAMQSPAPEESFDTLLARERQALMQAQKMRFLVAMSFSAAVGFGLGAFTTYRIACSLRPRR